jgi:hypothetical protein
MVLSAKGEILMNLNLKSEPLLILMDYGHKKGRKRDKKGLGVGILGLGWGCWEAYVNREREL